jgi:3-oxoacyl-[acyl-carrier protein] reductase
MTVPLGAATAGRVAIVTGGSRGVGRATVRRLASHGYAVVVDYVHDQRAAESTVEQVLADNGVAVAVRADVADELDVQRLFVETTHLFGGIDAVVHAVRGRIAAAPVAEVDLDEFDAGWRVSARAALIVNREAARQIRNGGAIVNLSSSVVGASLPIYGASEVTTAATELLTRALALEVRDRDITVNAVSLVLDRPCRPHRIAELVAYLLSREGRGLTGCVIRLDET